MFVWNSSVPLLKQVTGKAGIDNYKYVRIDPTIDWTLRDGNSFRRADYFAIGDVFGKNIVGVFSVNEVSEDFGSHS
jgi:hypothetical protein